MLLVVCLLAAACGKSATQPAAPVSSAGVVKASPQETTIARGESGELVLPINIAHGYHINANPPSYSYLIATELQFPQADGISVETISYPPPLTRKFPFAEKPLAVYEGDTILKARLKADKSARTGLHNLSAKLRVQACDDNVCYAPGVLDVTLVVNVK
jgi:thiol:disulfide interchange protein DsbD